MVLLRGKVSMTPWPNKKSSYYSTIKVSSPALCFPVGITGFVGVTSRDAHRAMFPSPRQENFYSQREELKTSVKTARVDTAVPAKAFKINVSAKTFME